MHFNKRKFFLVWARLLAFLAVAMLGRASFAAETLPVTFDAYGRMLVPVEIYGRMDVRHFLFDTAARYPVFLNRDSGALGIRMIDKGTLNHMDSSGRARLPVARVEAYALGSQIIEDAIIGVYPNWAGADGLMGNTAFHKRIVHWQPERKQLSIYPNLAPISGDDWMHLGGRPNKAYGMVLTTEYNGIEFDVIVATGTSRSIIGPDSVAKIFPEFWHPEAYDEDQPREPIIRGLNPDLEEKRPVPMPGFAIGGWVIEDFVPVAAYVDKEALTGVMNANVIVLGVDALLGQEIAFDFRDFHMWVKPE